jgi:hypothetical protein
MRAGEFGWTMVAGWCCARNPSIEEDLTMSERASTPGSSEGEATEESDVLDDARAADLSREVIRMQERHREGGIEPELDNVDGDQEPDA